MAIPNSLTIHRILSIIVRFVLGTIFIVAGIPKILDTASFATVVYNYHLLPDAFVNLFAITLPWLEVIIGIMLITGIWLPGTVILYNVLMIVFISALIFNISRGLDISCGCFTMDSEEVIDAGTIFRDVLILCGSLYLAFAVFVKKITSDRVLSLCKK